MYVTGTECKTIMYKGRVNHNIFFSTIKKITHVTKMPITPPDTITSAIFIKYKYLARTEPPLKIIEIVLIKDR